MCDHNKIKVIREERGYVWSCALCGDETAVWSEKIWETMGMDPLEEGQGFVFNIVERGLEHAELQA